MWPCRQALDGSARTRRVSRFPRKACLLLVRKTNPHVTDWKQPAPFPPDTCCSNIGSLYYRCGLLLCAVHESACSQSTSKHIQFSSGEDGSPEMTGLSWFYWHPDKCRLQVLCAVQRSIRGDKGKKGDAAISSTLILYRLQPARETHYS